MIHHASTILQPPQVDRISMCEVNGTYAQSLPPLLPRSLTCKLLFISVLTNPAQLFCLHARLHPAHNGGVEIDGTEFAISVGVQRVEHILNLPLILLGPND